MLGCRSEKDPGTSEDSSGTPAGGLVATGSTSGTAPSLVCVEQADNALRYDCSASVEVAAALSVSWTERGAAETRTLELEPATEHRFAIYALHELSEYVVTATTASGSAEVAVATGALPVDLQRAPVITGSASFDQLMFEHPCSSTTNIVVMDTAGRVIWYQPFAENVKSNTLTDDHTLLTLSFTEIVEHDLAGRELLRFTDGVDFVGPVHHDVFRTADGLTYALFAELANFHGTDYVIDGFYVFDAGGLVSTWRGSDHILPVSEDVGGNYWGARWPGAVDYTHANSIHVEADGTTWMSLRWMQSVLRVEGDPADPGFGTVEKTLSGNVGAPGPGDYTIVAAPGVEASFESQHDATSEPGGVLTLFDNRSAGTSRGLALQLDDPAGTATVIHEWSVGQRCGARGSTKRLANGHVLVTCATERLVMEFDETDPLPLWTMQLSCPNSRMLPEAQPVSI